MTRDRGFVLVNALILVAALSGIAVYLLSRAEGSRVRLAAGQEAAQISLGLDAFETLALTLLATDDGAVDYPGDGWARTGAEMALDHGRVTGDIVDEQGLFNLNWLANPEDAAAREGFARLAARIGLAPASADAIIAFLRPGGPDNRAVFAALSPPLDPVGGALLSFEQLRGLPGLRAASLDRLRLFATAIEAGSPLNVNSAPVDVLAALLPDVAASQLAAAVAARAQRPFASVGDFTAAIGLDTAPEGETGDADGAGAGTGAGTGGEAEPPLNFPVERLSVGSTWFRVVTRLDLGDRQAVRVTLIQRQAPPAGARVAWRLTAPP